MFFRLPPPGGGGQGSLRSDRAAPPLRATLDRPLRSISPSRTYRQPSHGQTAARGAQGRRRYFPHRHPRSARARRPAVQALGIRSSLRPDTPHSGRIGSAARPAARSGRHRNEPREGRRTEAGHAPLRICGRVRDASARQSRINSLLHPAHTYLRTHRTGKTG